MHGIIHAEMKKFVVGAHGAGVWDNLIKEAGIKNASYLTTATYPDKEAAALVTTAAKLLNVSPAVVMEGFGEFIVPHLIQIYKGLIRPEWKTLDLLENVESVIHTAVRFRDPGMAPPKLAATRTNAREVVMTYSSSRAMCSVAKGIAKGVAKHYGERLDIKETSCMLKGASSCTLVFKLI